MSAALREEAGQRGLTYIDVHAASQGHDVCSSDPWVNGQNVASDGTIAFHPFAREQAAVASMIAKFL